MVWLFSAAIVAGVLRSFSLFIFVVVVVLARAALLRAAHAWLAIALVLACAAIGWSAVERADADRRAVARAAENAHGSVVHLCGWVDEFPQAGAYGAAFVLATHVDGHAVRLAVRSGRFDVGYGDSLEVDARLATTSRVSPAFLMSRGCDGEARARFDDVHTVGRPRGCPLFRRVLWPLHRAARTRLARALGGEAALPVGLLLGERSMLDRRTYEAVRALGITHLLALSGMHLTMIAALAILATHWRQRRRDLVVAAALSLYVGVVGNVDSLTRAYVMALLILLARALVRPPRPVDALGKALFVMLLWAPGAILSVGLQLSFAATFAVLVCVARLPGAWVRATHATPAWKRCVAWCVQGTLLAFTVSVGVEVFIAPLQLHHFGKLSVVGPLATVVFLVPVTLLQGMALAASVAWPPVIGGALAISLQWASSHTRDAIVAVGAWAPAPVAIPEPNAPLYYAAVCALWAWPRRRLVWGLAALGLAASFFLGAR